MSHAQRTFVATAVALAAACSAIEHPPRSCDDLGEKTVGITRGDYAACAVEMLTALDTLQHHLQRLILQQDTAAQSDAERALRHLRGLMREVNFTADYWRESREGRPSLERWPDGAMRQFNTEIGVAAAQYMSALQGSNRDNLQEGSRRHSYARSAYARFR
jgi:hypothetical protein